MCGNFIRKLWSNRILLVIYTNYDQIQFFCRNFMRLLIENIKKWVRIKFITYIRTILFDICENLVENQFFIVILSECCNQAVFCFYYMKIGFQIQFFLAHFIRLLRANCISLGICENMFNTSFFLRSDSMLLWIYENWFQFQVF